MAPGWGGYAPPRGKESCRIHAEARPYYGLIAQLAGQMATKADAWLLFDNEFVTI
jgi:hypothetical protein